MHSTPYRPAICLAAALALASTSPQFNSSSEAISPNLVISQVYGGGGNNTAPFNADYIELYNRGTTPASLSGLSLQYASATGTGNFGASSTQLTELPDVMLNPGEYFLVQEAGGSNGVPLPTPDLIDPTPILMAVGAGKVALVTGTSSLGCNGGSTACNAAATGRIIDMVGYGNANFAEGSPAPTLTAITAAFRAGAGSVDTDNNSLDFTALAPAPRNRGTGGSRTLSIADLSVAEGDSGETTAQFVISLNGPAGAPGVTFSIRVADGTAHAGSDYIAAPAVLSIPEGTTSITYDVRILGDLAIEPDETFILTISDVTGATLGDGQATGTIRNDDVPEYAIHEIQGAGSVSPLANTNVATTGIVTGLKSTGFFIQTPDARIDASPETSEGVFVFQNSAPAVSIGDEVRVTGRVVEFRRASDARPDALTEIGGTVGVTVLSSGNPLPTVVNVTSFEMAAPSRAEQLERYEGMLVRAAALQVVAPTNGFGEFYGVLPGTARPFREPGIDVRDTMPAEAPSPATIPRFDGNFERLMVDSDEALSGPGGTRRAALQVATGATVSPVLGPLDYAFDEYRISLDHGAPVAQAGGATVIPAPAPAQGELTIAGLNLLNLFPPNPSNAAQVAAFNDRLTKISLTVRTVLRTPDILGLIEVGDLDVLRQLRDRINADAGTSYEAYLLESDDDTENDQDIGYLVNLPRVEVTGAPVQVFRDATFEVCGVTDILFDRPPFVLEARFQGMPVTVILNHLRSLIDIDGNTTPFRPAPCTETLGSRVREKRRLGAEQLADLIESRKDENLVVLGDMNAFEFSDGYVDVIGTLMGSPSPVEEVVEPSADRWNHELFNLAGLLSPADRYSFVFEGSAQLLDHVLVNQAMLDRVARFTYARTNADFPAGFSTDPTTTQRVSDHDAPVAYFAPVADLTTRTTMAATVVSGADFTYEFAVANAGPDVARAVSVSNRLPLNATYRSVVAPAGWTCVANVGEVVCEGASLDAGEEAAFVVSMNAVCAAADGAPLASTTTAASSTEREGSTANNASAGAGAISNPAPVIAGAAVDQAVLWPPSHKLRPVSVAYTVADNCGPVTTTLSVASNQPSGIGEDADWVVVDEHTLLLRAERSGTAIEGRTYTITITATDTAGNVGTSQVVVWVPHNR